jgi:hypothetical protein
MSGQSSNAEESNNFLRLAPGPAELLKLIVEQPDLREGLDALAAKRA